MPTVAEIEQALFSWAPRSLAEEWDNVGLLCGYTEKEVSRVLVALDPFEEVCREAHEKGAELLVTHHPLIFHAPNSITDRDSVGRCILYLAEHGISAINAHTNLDCAFGGVNDVLARALGLSDIRVIGEKKTDASGNICGLLRAGYVKESSFSAFSMYVKQSLHCGGIRCLDAGKPVRYIAVGGGACGSELSVVREAGCDTFVTSDLKYNQFRDGLDMGINLIDAGHFETENPVCSALADFLHATFPQLAVMHSEISADPVKFL